MTNQWHGGKGSKRRNADDKKYASNWDLIFGNKGQKPDNKDKKEVKGVEKS